MLPFILACVLGYVVATIVFLNAINKLKTETMNQLLFHLLMLLDFLPRATARKEAKDDFKSITDRIRFAFNMTEIEKLQDEIRDYEDAYIPCIDAQLLNYYVIKMRKAITEREMMVRAHRKMIQQQYQYN